MSADAAAKKAAPKTAAKAAPAAAKKAKSKSGKTVLVQRTGSPIRREGSQRATLLGLGLKRARQIVELEDTASVRGMIAKVSHLVQIVGSK